MANYQPFPILKTVTGQFDYLEEYVRPEDAFEPLDNAFVYRGALQRRNGRTLLAATKNGNPIMGIKQWTDETTGLTKLVVCDTKYAYLYDNAGNLNVLNMAKEQIGKGDGTIGPYTYTIGFGGIAAPSIVSGTFVLTVGVVTATDTPIDVHHGNLTGAGVTSGTINYDTGIFTITFTALVPVNTPFFETYTIAAPYFTGRNSNFFNATNYKQGNTDSPDYLYLVNNIDRITLFDGANLSRPPFAIIQADRDAYINDIATCLDLDIYKNRLIVQKPTLVGRTTPDAQSVRFSSLTDTTNLVADIAGNGGELSAPTDDLMQSSEFLRDTMVFFFGNTTWLLRYTSSANEPFQWQKINATKSTNAPYGTVPYDERITAMGAKGLIACDGVNVQRYDIEIIDQFSQIDQSLFQYCFAQRFDTINQTWMLFPSLTTTPPASVDTGSTAVLVYNFLENTWSTYTMALSCLGLFAQTQDKTFGSLGAEGLTWGDCDFPFDNYLTQDLAPILLGGDQDGAVYILDDGNLDFDYATSTNNFIPMNVSSARWNPFIQVGQKVQFGYIDFYYYVDPTITPPVQIDITFYTNNSDTPADTRTLTIDSPNDETQGMKRIYINNVGEFLKMNMQTSDAGIVKIIGIILWARPAGRLTP